MLTFRFSGADGRMVERETLTSGMVGKEVKLEFTEDWDDLTKTAVFMAGAVTSVVVGVSDVVKIPAEVLAVPMKQLFVGIYGTGADGTVTPTVRAEGPEILPGADPSGTEGVEPDLPVWAQIQAQVDELKENGAGAVEVDLTGYATEDWVRAGFQPKGDYLTEHQDISGKLDADQLPEAIDTALAQARESGEFNGADGSDYVLTDADMEQIAQAAAAKVPFVKAPSEPVFASGVSEMTDYDKVYVNLETGTFWQRMEATVTGETIADLDEGYTYPENSRLGSDGSVQTSGSYAGYTITPFIDLLGCPVPYTLHIEGMAATASTSDSYTRVMVYSESETKLCGGNTIAGGMDTVLNVDDANVTVGSDGSTEILFTETPKANVGGNYTDARYIRFSGKVTTTPSVYASYEETVTGMNWVDTGVSYTPNISEEEKQQLADDIIARIDTELLSVVGSGEVE